MWFLGHTHGTTPLNERSALRIGHYLHDTQQTQETTYPSIPPAGFLFVFSCTLHFIRTWFFVLIILHFASFCFFSPLYLQQHRHPCPRRDSNPQPQQAISCRPSPYTTRPLGFEPKTYVLERSDTGIYVKLNYSYTHRENT